MKEKFSKISILLLILFVSNKSFAQELLPTSTTGQIIKHTYYTLSYSEPNEQAEWVYYELTPAFVNGSQPRKDAFRPDPMVSSGSAQLSDYQGSGYDRGHLCPAGDMKLNATSMSETFFLSNMSPQEPSFNRGIWESLEATVRSWAITEGMIYVVTGGVLTSNKGKIGASGVIVPQYYYKVIYAPKGQGKMIAFVLANEKGIKQLKEYVVTVDSVENLTGIDFFPALQDSLENALESHSDTSLWTFSQYTSSSSSNKNKAVQCKGIAKSTGNRCKNMTTNANGYCNVHQGQVSGTNNNTISSSQSSGDGRCQAITQAGTRCKRKTEAGSKYCWQHKK